MFRLCLSAALVTLLALPLTASAAEIGSDHQGTQVQIGCGTGSACILAQDTVGGDPSVNVVPSAGKLTGFRVKGVEGTFRFVVLRVVNGALTVASQTPDITGQGSASDVSYTFDSPVAVAAGSFIGIQIAATGSVGGRDATADGNTNLLQFSADGDLTPEPDGPFEVFLSATFQPNPAPVVQQPGTGTQPAVAKPDPLAALRSGKRPKVTIAGGAVTVSKKGVVLIELNNSNGYAVKGSLSLAAGKLRLGRAKVSLAANGKESVKVKLSKRARRALRKRRRLRATAVAKVSGPVGKAGVTRKRLTLKAPARKRVRRRPSGGGGGGGGQTPTAGNRWVARKGTSGAYDDFKFTLTGGNITLTQSTLVFVSCLEMGGSYRSSSSLEIFNALGPWALGNQNATQKKQSVAVNQLVGSGQRTITYKLTSSRSGDRITGKLTMSFSDSKYNPFTNAITFINCSGTQSYEAIPG